MIFHDFYDEFWKFVNYIWFIYLGITFDIAIIDEIINSFNHIILGEAIILLEIGVILKLKSGRNS